MATARYLRQQLALAGLKEIDEVDSAVKRDRGDIINQFAPYYNGMRTANWRRAASRNPHIWFLPTCCQKASICKTQRG